MNVKFDLKKYLPLMVGIVGIAIVLLTGRSDKAEGNARQTNDTEELFAYTEMLEEKVRRLCEACDGVGSVTVAVMLDGGFEYEYARNTEYGENSYGDERREEYLVIGQGSGETCVLLRRRLPEIAGVGIVCTGADDDAVRAHLVSLVSAALNVGANKIYISRASQ